MIEIWVVSCPNWTSRMIFYEWEDVLVSIANELDVYIERREISQRELAKGIIS